jgi:hypothetical protein
VEFSRSFEVNGMLIQFGSYRKTATFATVGFPMGFSSPPAVVVSPLWENQHSGVGAAETIEEVTHTEFRLASGNKALNYFVTWIAIGPK